jgi:hypothetical protein
MAAKDTEDNFGEAMRPYGGSAVPLWRAKVIWARLHEPPSPALRICD